jgi:hypothetical protein
MDMKKYIFGQTDNGDSESEAQSFVPNPLPGIGKLLFPSVFTTHPTEIEQADDSPEQITAKDEATEKAPGLAPVGGALRLSLPLSVIQNPPSATSELSEPPSSKEFRRICSEIIPEELYVSGWLVAEDWEQIEANGITHVVNTACSVSKCPFVNEITYLPLSIEDSRNEDILSYVYPCIEFIEAAISSGGRVLVHCMEGVSRSCSIVIAYVMWKRSLTYVEAQAFVQAGRPVCQPNPSFICQLLEFEKRLSNTYHSRRSFRVTLRRCLDQFVLMSTSAEGKPTDRRFPYIYQEEPQKLINCVDSESIHKDFLTQLARDAVDRIARIEGFEPIIEISDFDPSILSIPVANFDADFAACMEFIGASGPTDRRESSEEPCTARSHKSLGSIDSARSGNRVKVHLLQPELPHLEPAIPYFDSDDLDSRSVYLFLTRGICIAWVGDEVIDFPESAIVEETSRLTGIPKPAIKIITQGAEPNEFWELFLRIDG